MSARKRFSLCFEQHLSEPVPKAVFDRIGKNSHAVVSFKKDNENNLYLDIRRKSRKWYLPHGVFLNKAETEIILESILKKENLKTKVYNNEIELVILKDLQVKIRKRYVPEGTVNSDQPPTLALWKGLILTPFEFEGLQKKIPVLKNVLAVFSQQLAVDNLDNGFQADINHPSLHDNNALIIN